MVSHDSPVPLHEQLAKILRERITSGEITGRVPSILTLAQQYEIAHNTAARALDTLKSEGLIIAVRGKGFYVSEEEPG